MTNDQNKRSEGLLYLLTVCDLAHRYEKPKPELNGLTSLSRSGRCPRHIEAVEARDDGRLRFTLALAPLLIDARPESFGQNWSIYQNGLLRVKARHYHHRPVVPFGMQTTHRSGWC